MDNNTQIEIRVLIQQLLGMPENSVRPADTSQPRGSGNAYDDWGFKNQPNTLPLGDSADPSIGGFWKAANDYAIVQLTDMVGQGWAGGYKHARQSSTATMTIDFMGDDAAKNANQLKIAMQTEYGLDKLYDLGVGYLSCSEPRNLTSLELERTKRYQVKLQLSYLTAYDMPMTVPDDYRDRYQNEPEIDTTDLPVGMIIEP